MLLALLTSARALEPAFDCAPLSNAADARRFAEPGATAEAAHERIVRYIQAQFEPGCPQKCSELEECYRDDCVTSTGTHIVIDHVAGWSSDYDVERTWSVLVEPAFGPLDSLRLESAYRWHYAYSAYYAEWSVWTWSASWVGTLDPELPADGSVGVTATFDRMEEYGSTNNYAYDRVSVSGDCSWAAAKDTVIFDHPWNYPGASWVVTMEDQVVTVDRWPTCEPTVHPATVDGAAGWVLNDWTAAANEDGDDAEASVDCDDHDPGRSPCMYDTLCDGIDQDCDGADDIDGDGDGAANVCAGGDDCDDAEDAVYPGAIDVPNNRRDEDCNGADAVDGDEDGALAEADCNDGSAEVYPGAAEVDCDGVDQDCDGADGPCPAASPSTSPKPDGCAQTSARLAWILVFGAFGLVTRRAASTPGRAQHPRTE